MASGLSSPGWMVELDGLGGREGRAGQTGSIQVDRRYGAGVKYLPSGRADGRWGGTDGLRDGGWLVGFGARLIRIRTEGHGWMDGGEGGRVYELVGWVGFPLGVSGIVRLVLL